MLSLSGSYGRGPSCWLCMCTREWPLSMRGSARPVSPPSALDGLLAGGRFATYSGGGYVVDLPTNRTLAEATLAELDVFLGRARRQKFGRAAYVYIVVPRRAAP